MSRPAAVLRVGVAERLRLEPWFKDVRDQVVRPDQVAATTLYFWSRWAPRLGPGPVLLLLWMRAQFARSRAEDERGEFQFPSQDELSLMGLGNARAVRAAIGHLEAHGFLARRPHYRWDAARRQTVHLPDRYVIALEDPIAPEDEQRVLWLAAQRVAQLSPQREGCDGKNVLHTTEVVHNRGGVAEESAPTPPSGRSGCVGRIVPHTPGDNDLRGVGAESAPRDSNVQEESTDNVNVEAPREGHDRRRALVEDLVGELEDPGSRRFYEIVVARMPHDCVRGALSEARAARRLGSVRRSAGAYFTDLIKRAAHELGVELVRPRAGG